MKFLYRLLARRSFLFILSFGLLLTAVPVLAETGPAVMMIDVRGNNHIPSEKILGAVSSSRIGQPVDPKKVQADMQAIMGLGWFADVRAGTESFFDGVKLMFDVIENPVFKEVKITGLTQMKPEELKSYFSQKPGEVFNTVVFRADLAKAIKYCQETKGLFIEPKIEKMNISSDGVVQIELVELKLGKIKLLGLEKTKEMVVLRELSVKEGDIIDYQKLKNDYMKIMRLRIFDSLDMRFESGSAPGTLDLVIELKEAQVATFTIGASFGENDGSVGGILAFSDNNLMGLGQTFSIDINFAEERQNVQFSFFEPWLDDKHTSFGLSVWNNDSIMTSTMNRWIMTTSVDHDNNPSTDPLIYNPGDIYDLKLIQTGLSMSLGRPLGEKFTGRIKLNLEKNEILKYWDSDGTTHNDGKDDGLNLTLNPYHPMTFWNNSIELSLHNNQLSYKDANFVNGGYELFASYEMAGKYLGGHFNNQKVLLEGKWFKSLSPSFVWGNRLQGSFLWGDYPDYDVLYLGGMNRLRGYEDDRYINANQTLLGTKFVMYNTEMRYLIPGNKNIELVGFYDAGIVNNLSGENVFTHNYGLGFRYVLPFMGLLRIDLAWNREGSPRTVFSIGEAF